MSKSFLERKIKEKNYQNSDRLIKLVREIELESILSNSIKQIEQDIIDGNFDSLVVKSGFILTNINTRLGKLNDIEKKKDLEYLLSDLFVEYLKQVELLENGDQTLLKIQENLELACAIGGFNYQELSSLLRIEKATTTQQKKILQQGEITLQNHEITLQREQKKFYYYDWNRDDTYSIDEFANSLYKKGVIYSVREFKRMFKTVTDKFSVRCNPDKKDLLLVIFDILKHSEIITPRGISGHFAPLNMYAVDDNNYILFEKDLNQVHRDLKRNECNYKKIKKKAEKIVAPFYIEDGTMEPQ